MDTRMKLWEVPFRYTLAGSVLVMAENASEAATLARELPVTFEPGGLEESNIFFDSDEVRVKDIRCISTATGRNTDMPEWGEAIESKDSPEEHGFEEAGSDDDDMDQKE